MKRTLSVLLAFALVITLFAGLTVANAADVSFKDVPSTHWAYTYITYLAKKDVLVGDGNGMFRPDAKVTRAEFIKMIDEVFGLKTTVGTSFTKVPSWAVDYIGRAKAQGFLLDYAEDTDFNQELTREEAVALIMRYLQNLNISESYRNALTDYYAIDTRYRDYVVAAVTEGIITGYKDGSFGPKNILSRAEALTILYKAAGAIYEEAAYTDSTGAAGNNAVIKGTATLYNLHLSGHIIIGEDVDVVNFIDCAITGNIYVRGRTVVTFKNCQVPFINFLGKGGELRLSDKSTVKKAAIDNQTSISIDENCRIETLAINAGGASTTADGKGKIDKILVYAPDVDTGKILPAAYEIGKGLSAVFAGVRYTEGSGKPVVAGFVSAYVSGYAYTGVYPFINTQPARNMIYVTFTPSVDGKVFFAAWRNTERTLSDRQIMSAGQENYGIWMNVKAGQKYDLNIEVPDDYRNYNVGLVLLVDAGTINARVAAVVYNQAAISTNAYLMGPMVPTSVKAEAPIWYVSVSMDKKSLVAIFDQPVFVKGKNGKLVSLSDLKPADLKALFAVEVTPANKIHEEPDFTAEAFDGPVTLVYLTPEDGIVAGEFYYVFLLQDLYNSQGTAITSRYSNVYVK